MTTTSLAPKVFISYSWLPAERLKTWLQENYSQVLPKSPIGKAIAYSLPRWDRLSLYATESFPYAVAVRNIDFHELVSSCWNVGNASSRLGESKVVKLKIMKVELVTKEDLDNFRLVLLTDLVRIMKRTDPMQPWLKSYEVRKLLKISAGTLQRLRAQGILPYSRIGGTFLYTYGDVKKLVDKAREER